VPSVPQCYCFVCDVNAAQCGCAMSHFCAFRENTDSIGLSRRAWGDGLGMQDHCNARNTPYWVDLRTFVRDGVVEVQQPSPDRSETDSSDGRADDADDAGDP